MELSGRRSFHHRDFTAADLVRPEGRHDDLGLRAGQERGGDHRRHRPAIRPPLVDEHPLVDEIVVVDDRSTDATGAAAARRRGHGRVDLRADGRPGPPARARAKPSGGVWRPRPATWSSSATPTSPTSTARFVAGPGRSAAQRRDGGRSSRASTSGPTLHAPGTGGPHHRARGPAHHLAAVPLAHRDRAAALGRVRGPPCGARERPLRPGLRGGPRPPHRRAGADGPRAAIAQVDLVSRHHRNRSLDELSPQALSIMQTAFAAGRAPGRPAGHAAPSRPAAAVVRPRRATAAGRARDARPPARPAPDRRLHRVVSQAWTAGCRSAQGCASSSCDATRISRSSRA